MVMTVTIMMMMAMTMAMMTMMMMMIMMMMVTTTTTTTMMMMMMVVVVMMMMMITNDDAFVHLQRHLKQHSMEVFNIKPQVFNWRAVDMLPSLPLRFFQICEKSVHSQTENFSSCPFIPWVKTKGVGIPSTPPSPRTWRKWGVL